MDINRVDEILSVTNFKSKTHFPLDKNVNLLPKLNVKHMISKHILPKGLEAKFYKSDNITTVNVEQILSSPPPNLDTLPESKPIITHYFRDLKDTKKDYSKEKHRKGYYIDLFCDLLKCKQDIKSLGNGKGFKITTPITDFIDHNSFLDIVGDYAAMENIEDEEKSSSDCDSSDENMSDGESIAPSVLEDEIIKPLKTLYQHEDMYFSNSSDDEKYNKKQPLTKSDDMEEKILHGRKSLTRNIRSIITRIPEGQSIIFKVNKAISTARCISIVTFHNFYPDASISFGNSTYRCQMHVLRNSAFYYAKRGTQRIYKMPNIGGINTLFKEIYDFMLTGKMKINVKVLLQVFIVARNLELNNLAASLWGHLEMLVSAYEYGALLLYLDAKKHKIDHIKYVLVNKIRLLFLKFVSSEEFRKLTDCELCTLLSSDNIAVNSEMEVFYSMILWLEFDWQTRQKYVTRLVKCIRFRLMDIQFLPRLRYTNRNIIVDYVLQEAHESKVLCENIIYWTVRKMAKENSQFKFPGCTKEFKQPERSRLWIFNREINYHHKHYCPLYVPITYSEFKSHIIKIQNEGNESNIELLPDSDTPCCINIAEEVYQTNMYSSDYETEKSSKEDMSEGVDKVPIMQTKASEIDQEVLKWDASDSNDSKTESVQDLIKLDSSGLNNLSSDSE